MKNTAIPGTLFAGNPLARLFGRSMDNGPRRRRAMERDNKNLALAFLGILVLLSCGCTLQKKPTGPGGIVEGKAVLLDGGFVGIEGEAYPYAQLFPVKEKVKYRLCAEHSALLHDRYGIKAGDGLYFFFSYMEIGDGDWNTVISIMTDLTINGVLE